MKSEKRIKESKERITYTLYGEKIPKKNALLQTIANPISNELYEKKWKKMEKRNTGKYKRKSQKLMACSWFRYVLH